tara:strand:- start:88 stop:636 length:549 start_codon:yes stop_codon:yes gene_type:complete
MSSEKDEDIFIKSLIGVKPLKKSDKILNKNTIQKKTTKTEKAITKRSKKHITKEEKPKTTKKLIIEENKTNKKLKKGKIKIDRKIDLHGYSLDEAKEIFLNTVNYFFYNNQRCLLFITGKGMKKIQDSESSEKKLYYGKIRSNFLNWTQLNNVSNKILNVQQAGIEHGGDGAFFVYLRKNKS